MGGTKKQTEEKAAPNAEVSVYGLSDAPPAVGDRERETQECSGKFRGEGDDNRKKKYTLWSVPREGVG